MALVSQSGDQATYFVLSVMQFCRILTVSHPTTSPGRSPCCSDLEQLLVGQAFAAGPGCPRALGEHVLPPRDGPWLFGGRDPVSVTPVCHLNLFLTPAGSGSSHSNRSAFSALQN